MNLKKPKFWDYKQPNFLAYVLYPLALLLQILNSFKIKKFKNNLKIKTICIGNIYVGGTGKTSLSIKINEILNKKKINSCFIKKFYKNQIDEQKILNKNGKLFLSSKRIDAIKKAQNESYDIAILDDGLQDKSFTCDVNIVCFNNTNWIGNGMTIPSGPLRENINNLKNYKHTFLNGNLENVEYLKKQILQINPEIKIHLGKYQPINLDKFNKKDRYLLFSGIGNHQTFVSMARNNGLNIIRNLEFPDHYTYSNNDIDKIIDDANKLDCKVITTEKDYNRINNYYYNHIKFIKVELKIIDEDDFLESII